MPATNLEVSLKDSKGVEGIGTKILELIKDKDVTGAAELALAELGIERAIKVLLNNYNGVRAGQFAERKGYGLRALALYQELGLYKEANRLAKELGLNLVYKDRPNFKPGKPGNQPRSQFEQ